jgi:hypothetical protein
MPVMPEKAMLPDPPRVEVRIHQASYMPPLLGSPRPLPPEQDFDLPQPMPSGPGASSGTLTANQNKTTAPKPGTTGKGPDMPETLGQPTPVITNSPPDAVHVTPGPAVVAGPPVGCVAEGNCCDGNACCAGHGLLPRLRNLWDRCWCEDNTCTDQGGTFWFSGEYLLWWIKSAQLPPLVTTSPAGTPRAAAGVLGVPGTTTLFGGDSLDLEERSGGRFTLGYWLDDEQCLGLEGSFFFLGERSIGFMDASGGNPILARPFTDAVTGAQASELVAFPGVVSGGIAVRDTSRLYGADLNLRAALCRGCNWRLDVLGGFRYFNLEENIAIMENLTIAPTAPLAGSGIMLTDSFTTHNNFYGGQLGLDLEWRRGRWSLHLMDKIALGDMHEVVNINGGTTFVPVGGPAITQTGGFYALPSNIGRREQDRFAVLDEAGVKLGYQVTDHMTAFVGYSFLYASSVVRPEKQIDTTVNTSQLPSVMGPGTLVGPARPIFTFRPTDFWAQGVNFGLEFRY